MMQAQAWSHEAVCGRTSKKVLRVVTASFFLRKRFASAILQECVAGKMKEKRETDRMKP